MISTHVRLTCLGIVLACSIHVVAETTDVVIFHTTDLHGHATPTHDYDGNKGVGGLYQLAGVLEPLRAKHPASLLVDNGDTVQGTIGSYLDSGASYIACLNALRVDVMNIGNHEFDWGVDVLGTNLMHVSNAVVCANIHWASASPSPLGKARPFVIREVGGMRIALLGLTHPKVPYWSINALIKATVVEPPAQALLRVMPLVRAEHPDAIVLLAHMGLVELPNTLESALDDVVRQFPDIDVVVGGHTHRVVTNALVGDTLFTQAGYHGIALGEIHLAFDSETRALMSKRAVLHGIGPDAPQSAAMKAVNAASDAREAAEARRTLSRIDGKLGGEQAGNRESADQTLICEAIASAVDADIVFHGSFGSSYLVDNRVMTMADLFIFVPYENRVVTMDLTPKEIGVAVECLLDYWDSRQFAFPYGARVSADIGAPPGKRVSRILGMNGRPLDESRRYRVAFNSYMAASGGTRYMPIRMLADRASSNTRAMDITTRDAVALFLGARKSYKPHVVTSIEVRGKKKSEGRPPWLRKR